MNHRQILSAVLYKTASAAFWDAGVTNPQNHQDPGYEAVKDQASSQAEVPKNVEVFGGSNSSADGKPSGVGAMDNAVWLGHPGVVAGKGGGNQLTPGMPGGLL